MADATLKRFIQLSSIFLLIALAIQFGLISPVAQVLGESNAVTQDSGLWYSPHELDFGKVGVDTLSPTQAVTITNVGATAISFAGGAAPAPFSATQNCAPSLNPGESCQYFYRFSPTETGVISATTGPGSNAGPLAVTLHGTGVGPDFTYSPLSIDFGRVFSGTTTAAHTVTIKNTGLATLSFAGGAAPDPFSATQNCAPGLAPGDTCEYFYRFSPTSTGTFTTTTGPGSNAGKQMEVKLRGRGVSGFILATGFTASPLELDFGPVGLGQMGAPQIVTIRNTSLFATLTDFAGGGVSPPFSATQNCAGGVPPGESCQYTFRFSPTSTGVFSDTSNTSTNLGPFTILLHGTGEGAKKAASPLSLDFGPTPLSTTSPPQRVIIKNTGAITLTNFAGGGVSPPFSATQNCAGGVPPGESCHYTFYFSPTAPGLFSETSNSSTNAGPFTIHLSGGMAPPGLAARFVPGTIEPEGTSTLELSIANPNPNLALTDVSVSNVLPSGLSVQSASSAGSSAECGTPSFNPATGATSLSFAGGTIEGSEICLIQVDVTALAAGTYVNTTNVVGASNPAGTGNSATATLFVEYQQYLPLIDK